MESKLLLRVVVSRLFAENCYIATLNTGQTSRSRCVVIDPGLDVERILATLTENRLTPTAIILTHGHADHIAGVEPIKRCFPACPIVIGRQEAPKLQNPDLNLSSIYCFAITTPPADQLVDEGDCLDFADIKLEVFDTPGHSSGHVIYIWKGGSPWIVFGGDVLFREGIGRTDFADGNMEQLVEVIHTKLFTLPDDTIVLPGHGPTTTIGHEKEANPYVGRQARQHNMRFV